MKKISIILAALAACFAVSCTKEAPTTEPQDPSAPAGMKKVTITATAEGATKTTYTDNGEGGGVFSWTEGDQISVWCSDDQFHTLTAEAEGASVRFSGMIPEGVSLGWYAFYPADENHADCAFSIPQYKDLSKQFSADLPMGAQIVDGAYVFKHMTSAIELTFSNIPDEVKTIVISFVNESMKFSGLFSSHISNDRWIWSTIEEGVQESDRTYIRKVSVENNTAKLYVPYRGKLWGGYDNTINIIGFDEDGNEYVLLRDRNMPGRDLDLTGQGIIVPVASLELPDYIDFDNIDWTAGNVAVATNDDSDTEDIMMKELRAVADSKYLYLKATTSTATLNGANYFDVSFCDGEGDSGVWWGWTTKGKTPYWKEHKGSVDAEGNLVSMQYSHNGTYQNIKCHTIIEAEKITWYLAYPIEYVNVYKNSVGKAYVSCLLWKEYADYWACPARGNAMLEVTLP